MGENHASAGGLHAGDSAEFFEQVAVGNTVESIAPHASRGNRPRDRQQSRDDGQIVVECRVEASDLRCKRQSGRKRFDQLNFRGQMVGIPRADALEFQERVGIDPPRL